MYSSVVLEFLLEKVEPRSLEEVCVHLDNDSVCKVMFGLLYISKCILF